MPIPDYQSIMLPLLKFANDGQEHSLRETIEALADKFNLTVEERSELLPSGQQAVLGKIGTDPIFRKNRDRPHFFKRA